MSGWGVMNQVAIKEAAAINYPMDKLHRQLVVLHRFRRPARRAIRR